MKKTLGTLAISAGLALAACGTTGPPEPVKYPSMEDLQAAAADAGVECQWAPPGPVLPSHVTAYRECTDSAGARPAAVIFDSDSDQQERLDEYRGNATWAQMYPAILVGEQWSIECPAPSTCEPWRDALGGTLVEAPDY